ncbi:TfoX/Sxy family protein [Alcanivorax sp. 1008]|uniref:TfoX/Sxy family protein n=1 Tax=Alcanivorax sp. 1008 TaxID=2816853 RepID=UPI001DA53C07|nr:TfoX/Sxy family protein [Alcanivorax sp. 1008]MCC1495501.1 TfoX/Sxy family protein [Alcanivorax sp. 1008]
MSQFTQYLQEVFELFGPISARKMFGGSGIYHQGLMFGLVSDDILYLKADAENVSYFQEQGLGPFEYNKQGKVMKISYYQAPDEIMDDREQAAIWAQRSFAAALRGKKPAGKPRQHRLLRPSPTPGK